MLLAGLGIFAAGCLLSAAAPNVSILLSGRMVSGLGAALVMPATLSLLMQVTPPARKPQAIAGWAAATGAAGALGNLGGGFVLQWLPWQGLLLIIGPLALLLAVTVVRIARRGQRHPASLDPVGTTLLTATVFAVLFGVIEGPDRGWRSLLVLASFAAAFLLTAFIAHALKATDPLLDPRVFTITKLRTGTIGVALGVAVVGTVLTSRFAEAVPPAVQDDTGSTSQTLRAAPAERTRRGPSDRTVANGRKPRCDRQPKSRRSSHAHNDKPNPASPSRPTADASRVVGGGPGCRRHQDLRQG